MTSTNFIVNMNIHRMVLCRYSDLNNQETTSLNDDEPFNLYMILKGNKIILVPDKSKLQDDGQLNLEYQIHNKGEVENKVLTLNVNPIYKNTKVEINYPFKIYKLFNDSEFIGGGHIAGTLREIRDIISENRLHHKIQENDEFEFLNLELLYIGQAQGKKQESTAIQRLVNHSTYQKILALENEVDPDCEIYIGLMHFEVVPLMTVTPGYINHSTNIKDNDPAKIFHTLLNTEKFRRESINIAEAALIKFFEPIYNSDFSDNFPSKHHKSYNFFYNNFIHSVMIEFFPYYNISSRVSTIKRENYSGGFISFQITGESATIGPLTIPSHNG